MSEEFHEVADFSIEDGAFTIRIDGKIVQASRIEIAQDTEKGFMGEWALVNMTILARTKRD